METTSTTSPPLPFIRAHSCHSWSIFSALLFTLIFGGIAWGDEPPVRFEKSERHMGSEFRILLYARDEASAETAFRAAFAVIAEYDKLLSDYNAESELMRLCAKAPTPEPIAVSEPFWNVMLKSRELSEKTGGAFDPTVGHLTRLWRRAKRQRELPSEAEIAIALKGVGLRHVRFHESGKRLELTQPDMRLDLGGIAPGYAADEALKTLEKLGITHALVDASGDVALGEPPPGEKGWRVGIAPLRADAPPDTFLSLARGAIATSGDAFRGVEIGGIRYSHIVDPKTGIGLKHRSSVTVIAPTAATADALATAASVLGPKEGLRVIAAIPNCEVRFVFEEGGEVKEVVSEGFRKFNRPVDDPR